MSTCEQMIDSNDKLDGLKQFGKIALIINFIVVVLQVYPSFNFSSLIFQSVGCLLLLGAINTLYFFYWAFYLFFAFYYVIDIGITIGYKIQEFYCYSGDSDFKPFKFWFESCIDVFSFCFYLFAIIVFFPAYKESKALFSENGPRAANQGEEDIEENRNAGPAINRSSQQNTTSNFRAFAGRGVAVGGS